MFFASLCFFLVILLFKWLPPQHSDEVLFDAPQGKKTIMCLTGRTCVFGELCLGMSYSTVYGTSVNESTLYIK